MKIYSKIKSYLLYLKRKHELTRAINKCIKTKEYIYELHDWAYSHPQKYIELAKQLKMYQDNAGDLLLKFYKDYPNANLWKNKIHKTANTVS